MDFIYMYVYCVYNLNEQKIFGKWSISKIKKNKVGYQVTVTIINAIN